MTIEIQTVQRLRQLTEASFATDGTGTLANFTDVPFVEGSLQMVNDSEMLNPMYAQQFKDGHPTQLNGIKSCTLGFGLNLASTGTAAVSGTTAVQGALGEILAAVMGGEDLAVGTTVSSATDGDTLVPVNTAAVSIGCALGWVNASGDLEARPVANEAAGTTTMRLAFSGTATTGDILYRSATYYLAEDPTSTLQFLIQGEESDDAWLQLGCQLDSMSFDLPVGQLPKATFNFKGAQYLTNTSTSGTITGSLTAATYTYVSPTHFVGGAYLQTYNSSTAVTALQISQLTVSPALAYVPQTAPSGTNTIVRWVRNRVAPVCTGSFVVPFQDLTHWITRDAETLKQLIVQFGTAAGSTVLLDFPTIQITNVQRQDASSIAGTKVDFVCQRDGYTSGTGEINQSAFRIHLL